MFEGTTVSRVLVACVEEHYGESSAAMCLRALR